MDSTFKISGFILLFTFVFACKTNTSETSTTEKTKDVVLAPNFDSSLALEKVQKQVDFGPRVPNSKGHQECGDWIIEMLESYDLGVEIQEFKSNSFDGTSVNARNIIASYNPEATKRVLLAAHWDTRSVADQDDERKQEPILGANDGGSGVAVLLQIAETIAAAPQKPNIGIDYIFFDVEDGGKPDSYSGNALNEYGGYLLGSDYWSKNPHKENYSAFYGILLDMVGAKGATFLKEQASMQVAPSVVNKIWRTANSKGYSSMFLSQNGPAITDDHLPVIINRKIPMIDIIDQKLNGDQTFFEHWHTHDDNMSAIAEGTLEAVGETLLQVLYEEGGIQ